MPDYYYADGDERRGPFTEAQLRGRTFPTDTLFWREGLAEWTKVGYLHELRDVVTVIRVPDHLAVGQSVPTQTAYARMPPPPPESAMTYDPELDPGSGTDPGFSVERAFSGKGRIRRTEYGVTTIIVYVYHALLQVAVALLTERSETAGLLLLFAFVPSLWLFYAQGAKRCHDRGNSGWYQLIPFYFFVMLFGDGERGPNRFGPDPKAHLWRARAY